MNYKIWYKGNTSLEGSTELEWANAPDDGVIGIAIQFERDENGIMLGELVSGSDWYWMHNGKIYQSGTSSDTPDEWLPHNAPEGSILKKGRWTSEEELAVIDSAMLEWVK